MFFVELLLIGLGVCFAVGELLRLKKINTASAAFLVCSVIATILLAGLGDLGKYFPFATNIFVKITFVIAVPAMFAFYWIPTWFPSGLIIIMANYLLSVKRSGPISFKEFLKVFVTTEENKIVVVLFFSGLVCWLIAGAAFLATKLPSSIPIKTAAAISIGRSV